MDGGLLAIDLGLRCGLARYDRAGRLVAFRSTHFGSRAALKRGALGVLVAEGPLEHLVLEGDRALGDVWARVAEKRGVAVTRVSAERWRPDLLLPREQRSGQDAKRHADTLARRVIAWSGAPKPTSLTDDAAEAILIGWWAVVAVAGWRETWPELPR